MEDGSIQPPTWELMDAIYRHMPTLVVVLTSDGAVLYVNACVERVTGYGEGELRGRNFWATLFPGRLFAQVPKFVSAVHPAAALGSDVPMALKTKNGAERVVGWTRVSAELATGRVMICFGTDLTDRLNAAEAQGAGKGDAEHEAEAEAEEEESEFGPGVGNAGTVDGEIVMPLAISPPMLPGDASANGGAAIQQVHEFLVKIEERVEAMEAAFSQGELGNLAGIAARLRLGAHACGLLDFSKRAEMLHTAAARGAMEEVSGLVQQIVSMVRPERAG